MRNALLFGICLVIAAAPALADGDLDAKVKRFFERFDADKDGNVTKAEFADERLFERLDVDKDGKITAADFKPLESGPKVAPKDDAIANLFKKYDGNNDGKISRDEMSADPKTFHALDRNVDGVVDKAEAIRITAIRAAGNNDMGGGTREVRPDKKKKSDGSRQNMMLQRFDKNGDGKLSKQEFLAAQEQIFAKLDRDGDGQLAGKELNALGGGKRGKQGRDGRGGGEMAARILKKLDRNGDGVISRDEAPERLPFDRVDTNGDGKLTKEELTAMGKRMGKGKRDGAGGGDMAKKMIERLDKNGDGAISKDEAPERLQGMFDRLDGNGDGKLTAEELAAARKRR